MICKDYRHEKPIQNKTVDKNSNNNKSLDKKTTLVKYAVILPHFIS